jgi:aryl-alcohol dehydrogenase-like predicted oxidoreductase
MARELGLGVTPWSPLRGGVLSGKYTRENAGHVKPDRGDRVAALLNERSYAVVDELISISRALGATPAAVALAWVQSQPGVTSTIIGARRLDQLDENLAAIDLRLGPDHLAALNRLSEPTLDFPAQYLKNANTFMNAGTTVNGESSQIWPVVTPSKERRA